MTWNPVTKHISTHPNIIIFLVDDMGTGDTSAYQDWTGNRDDEQLYTPSLERLARLGVRFTDAHTPSTVCTPTRYALLTGRYCWRTQLKHKVAFGPHYPPLIEKERPTLATILQEAGYRTGISGKWHVGLTYTKSDGSPAEGWDDADVRQPLTDCPEEHGFDYHFITNRSHGTSGNAGWIENRRCIGATGKNPSRHLGLRPVQNRPHELPARCRFSRRSSGYRRHKTTTLLPLLRRQFQSHTPHAVRFTLNGVPITGTGTLQKRQARTLAPTRNHQRSQRLGKHRMGQTARPGRRLRAQHARTPRLHIRKRRRSRPIAQLSRNPRRPAQPRPQTHRQHSSSSSSQATMARKTRAKNPADTTAVAKPTSTKAAIACLQSLSGNRATSATVTTRHPAAQATSRIRPQRPHIVHRRPRRHRSILTCEGFAEDSTSIAPYLTGLKDDEFEPHPLVLHDDYIMGPMLSLREGDWKLIVGQELITEGELKHHALLQLKRQPHRRRTPKPHRIRTTQPPRRIPLRKTTGHLSSEVTRWITPLLHSISIPSHQC